MAKITYLLGAGASANAMPVVKEIPIATLIVRDFFKYILSQIDADNKVNFLEFVEHEEKIRRIVETLSIFHRILLNHSSVDTFFKKMHLTNQKEISYDNYGTIIKVKIDEFLSIYNFILLFIEFGTYNHLFENPNSVLTGGAIDEFNPLNEEERSKAEFIKSKTPLDLRYDTFFATVLKSLNGKIKLDDNINIVSWNYDNQLERGFLNYLIDDEIHSGDVLMPGIKTFKLNGTSWPHIEGGNNSESFDRLGFQHFLLKNILDIPVYVLEFLKSIEYQAPFNEYKFNKNIYFQWHDNLKELREKAFNAVKETDVLVIIGYTFPTFNRDVDRQLYRSMEKLRKVYIVDVDEKRAAAVKSSFRALLPKEENIDNNSIWTMMNSLDLELSQKYVKRGFYKFEGDPNRKNCIYYHTEIEEIADASQFYIPPEF